jgi:hypothetical protein
MLKTPQKGRFSKSNTQTEETLDTFSIDPTLISYAPYEKTYYLQIPGRNDYYTLAYHQHSNIFHFEDFENETNLYTQLTQQLQKLTPQPDPSNISLLTKTSTEDSYYLELNGSYKSDNKVLLAPVNPTLHWADVTDFKILDGLEWLRAKLIVENFDEPGLLGLGLGLGGGSGGGSGGLKRSISQDESHRS